MEAKQVKPKESFASFFGLNSSIGAMIFMVILIGVGEKMAERFLPIYLIALGGSTLSIGLLNGMDNLLSALYSFPGGYLSDKFGYKKALSIFTLIAMFGYLLVILIPSWQAVLIGSVFFIAWTAVSLPAIMSLVSATVPKNKRAMGVSVHSLVRRIPMALGPILGGFFIGAYGKTHGVKIAFIFAFVLGAISLVFQHYFIKEKGAEKDEPYKLRDSIKFIDKPLRNLLIADILVRFAEQIPYAFVVVWVVEQKYVGLSALQFGILTTVEMVTAMLIYLPVAYFADRSSKKPFVVTTFGFFTLFPLVLMFSKSFSMLVLAFIVRGLKEFGEPTRKSLIMDLAPENAKAATFGTYYLIRDVIVSLAAFGSALLWNISPQTNFTVAFFFGVLGTLYFAFFGKSDMRVEG